MSLSGKRQICIYNNKSEETQKPIGEAYDFTEWIATSGDYSDQFSHKNKTRQE